MTKEQIEKIEAALAEAKKMGMDADYIMNREEETFSATLNSPSSRTVLQILSIGDMFIYTVSKAKETDNLYQSIMDKIGPFLAIEKARAESSETHHPPQN